MNAKDFTMEDKSSLPYAWALESIDYEDIKSEGVEKWVREYVKGAAAAWRQINDVKASTETIYKTWRRNSGEYGAMVAYVEHAII